MGRTLLTYRILLDQYRFSVHHITRNWTKKNQQELQQELSRAHYFADAASYWVHGHYKGKILLTILFAQYKHLVQMKDRIENSNFIRPESSSWSKFKLEKKE